MDTINTLVLKDPDLYPDEELLQSVLGSSYKYYIDLLELYKQNSMKPTWRYYNDGKAWLCKVQLKTKTITWMSAWEGFMQATIYIPVRLLEDVLKLELDDPFIQRINSAKNVGKSKPCTFDIKNRDEILNFQKVMDFKIHCR